ncbi:hypothetical protein L1987_62643 [Smallanthus sonchifolius]|uniref:Uncharacterized protein n=1 Tax=Smallanthus sonchifolius TaxID=185202 RepID=A0ACB9CB23_9ASTR|nr:hypothetical protein L1987_62643 [Smallanthus sonchifolius]
MGTNQVVVTPFPSTGHINPLLNLCHLLSSRSGLTVVVTEEWHRIFGSDSKPDYIQFATIPNNVIPSEPEPSNNRDNIDFFLSVESEMETQFNRLLDTMAVKFIIADLSLGQKTFDLSKIRNIPVAAYWPPRLSFCVLCYLMIVHYIQTI